MDGLSRDGTAPALLLVEDDDLVRLVTADLLVELGYAVREAATAEAALALLDDGAVEILLTDIRLPDADGRDLARQARAMVPDLAVVLISGEVGEEDGALWLTKPYSAEQLRQALASVGLP